MHHYYHTRYEPFLYTAALETLTDGVAYLENVIDVLNPRNPFHHTANDRTYIEISGWRQVCYQRNHVGMLGRLS